MQGELGASAGDLAGAAAEMCPDADENCLLDELREEINEEKTGVVMEPIKAGEWA